MNFANVKTWTIQEGEVIVVKDNNNSRIIWQKQTGPDYSEPFYVENITNSTETLTIRGQDSNVFLIEYSTDKNNWNTLGTTSSTSITLNLNPTDKIYLRANTNFWKYTRILGCSKVGGNIMSLLYGSNFTGNETMFPSNDIGVFNSLFNAGIGSINTNLRDSADLILPANVLNEECYESMFNNCSNLINTPRLNAMNLAHRCYRSMFYRCSSLQHAPLLPATVLAQGCYVAMFTGCTSLVNSPVMYANTLERQCCATMFSGCTSLKTIPNLLATTLSDYCYQNMFSGCTSLKKVDLLPAATLVTGCYTDMFNGCTALEYVKCLATSGIDTSGTPDNSTYEWLYNVSSTGTFVKAAGVTWPRNSSGIPSGWTVQEV